MHEMLYALLCSARNDDISTRCQCEAKRVERSVVRCTLNILFSLLRRRTTVNLTAALREGSL